MMEPTIVSFKTLPAAKAVFANRQFAIHESVRWNGDPEPIKAIRIIVIVGCAPRGRKRLRPKPMCPFAINFCPKEGWVSLEGLQDRTRRTVRLILFTYSQQLPSLIDGRCAERVGCARFGRQGSFQFIQ